MIRATFVIIFVLATVSATEPTENSTEKPTWNWDDHRLPLTSMKQNFPVMLVENDYEHGVTDTEFRLFYPGVADAHLIIIKIYSKGVEKPILEYRVEEPTDDPTKQKVFYFALKEDEALVGEYEVVFCTVHGSCSPKRAAFSKVIEEGERKISCVQGKGNEDLTLTRFIGQDFSTFEIKMKGPEDFMNDRWYDILEASDKALFDKLDYSKLGLNSNPAYTMSDGKKVFYAAVLFDASQFKPMFDTAVSQEEKDQLYRQYGIERKLSTEVHAHAYCERKYILSANAHIVDADTREVKRRFKTTLNVNDYIKTKYIFNGFPPKIHVEITQYDDEKVALPPKSYDVFVSICATDKDKVDSTICTKAIVKQLEILPDV